MPFSGCLTLHGVNPNLKKYGALYDEYFVGEVTYPLVDGNILLIKIKIKCPTGQNLEIMTLDVLKL